MDFRCHCCGCVFEAEPASFILDTDESPLEVEYGPDDDEDYDDEPMGDVAFPVRVQTFTREELKSLTIDQLDQIGMTSELRDMILAAVPSEEICEGAVALCNGCRKEIGL